jgi:hypothetical protein
MGMTKKDFEALASELAPVFAETTEWSADSREEILAALYRFCAEQNPKFDAKRFRAAVEGGLHDVNGNNVGSWRIK